MFARLSGDMLRSHRLRAFGLFPLAECVTDITMVGSIALMSVPGLGLMSRCLSSFRRITETHLVREAPAQQSNSRHSHQHTHPKPHASPIPKRNFVSASGSGLRQTVELLQHPPAKFVDRDVILQELIVKHDCRRLLT